MKVSPKETKRFDPILKEIILKAISKILSSTLRQKIKGKIKTLPEEIRFVKVLRPDILFEASGKIFHIEIQVQKDKSLPERMLKYFIAIKEKLKRNPIQIVLFIGKGKPPPSLFKEKSTSHKFKVVDMKNLNPLNFIKSNKPEEVVIGILAGKYKDKQKTFDKVIKKIPKIVKDNTKLIKYIESINFLASLFDINLNLEPMPIEIDITKTPFYKWGEKRGFEKGLKEGEQKGILKGIKEGEQKGLKEGLKEAILMDVELKFGRSKVKQVKAILWRIDDIKHLKKIKKEVIKVKSWNEFLKILRNSG